MQISDEMVEIAARAIHSAFQSGRGSPHPWPENVPTAQAPWLKEARAALEAVAPIIRSASAPPPPWPDAQMRQMGGEMTAQEIRAVRAFAPMIRKAALEEAAKVAESRGWESNKSARNVDGYSEGGFDAADEIADAIRKLGERDEPSINT
jgi:hypothetical protein